jgi:lysophospholipase L1-like esterase
MKRWRIEAIGDSLTFGYPYPTYYSWVRRVADRLAIIIENKGVCGETTADMRRRFTVDVVAARPDWVIITGGSNDAFLGIEAGEVAENVQAMAKEAVTRSIRPIIGLAPPMTFPEEALLAEYRQVLRMLAAEAGLPVVDFYLPLLDHASGEMRPGLHVDGVHPNEDGYELMADAAVKTLTEIFATIE